MRRSLVILNLGLLFAAGLLGYGLRAEWKSYRSRAQWIHQASAAEPAVGLAQVAGAAAVENWGEIAARNVFFPDRSGLTPQSATAPPEPILFGTINLGSGPIALMSEGAGRGFRQVRLGEPVGGYKLVAVEGQKVTLEWAGGRIKLDAAESSSRLRGETAAPATAAPPRVAPSGVAVVSPSGAASASSSNVGSGSGSGLTDRFPQLRGVPISKEQLAELEREPPGTIKGGKRKRVNAWPFGVQIWWEDVKPGEEKK